ncbi:MULTISPECIES: PilN domain-containing protein [Gammaproteobacteria]|uniref:PilN domain-containing protein n=1 Tax=Gammaproteobacteria TaxID=1236 RepID=UPI001ADA4B99|nr:MULTISPECIES: PilN domain-containing protein [Gammaproteobacteria]MBO9480154.1 PilN domain-containing protein [Salinisphaera sp. G21_0]MBO9493255.1 PilN domain-containing protein [Thalassotalea sp. G20_0]
MARINLLPWREELRKERKQRFIAFWAITVLVGIGLIFIGDLYISHNISHQKSRNQYLQNEITQLNQRISEIKDLRTKKEQLLERMQVIQNLQGNRPVIVRIFDQVAHVVPEGVYFKQITLEGDRLSLVGVAESNNRISALMRNFDNSEWFAEPNLTAVRKVAANSQRWNEFDLTVKQINPTQAKGGL